MEMWIIDKKDFRSFDQLYNINSFGKIVTVNADSLREYYTPSNLCFLIENLIEVDSSTIVPVLDSIEGYLETNPLYSTLREVNRGLHTPIESNVLSGLVLETEKPPAVLSQGVYNNIPTALTARLDTAQIDGIKNVRQTLQALLNFRYSRLPDSYLINFLYVLVERNFLSPKLVELFVKVVQFTDKVREIKNGKLF